MNTKEVMEILNAKMSDDINILIEYKEVGIYQGINGCIKYIQELTGCDEPTAIDTIVEYEELRPSDETPAQYEARVAKANMEYQESLNKPKCPTCGSTNLKKISTASKVANTAFWGLLGTKRFKTFHCNNCGYEW